MCADTIAGMSAMVLSDVMEKLPREGGVRLRSNPLQRTPPVSILASGSSVLASV